MVKENHFEVQYHFDRDDFVKVFDRVFSEEESSDFLQCLISGKLINMSGDLSCFCKEDEVYLIDLASGVIISWYKCFHVGRINRCNYIDFTLYDLEELFVKIKENYIVSK